MDDSLREPPYPFQAHLGFTIDDWSADRCRLTQPMVPHIGNRYGIPHGGGAELRGIAPAAAASGPSRSRAASFAAVRARCAGAKERSVEQTHT